MNAIWIRNKFKYFNKEKDDKVSDIDKKILELKEMREELKVDIERQMDEINADISEYTKSIATKKAQIIKINQINSHNTQIGKDNTMENEMGITTNVNNQGGNFNGNLNAGSGKQFVRGNISIVQNAADKEKEDQYLKALAELKEEISKIKSSETECQEMKKAVQKIEEEIQSDEPDLDVVKVKAEKLVTIAERVDQIDEGVEKTSKLIDKVKNLGEKIIIYLPALTDALKSVIPI